MNKVMEHASPQCINIGVYITLFDLRTRIDPVVRKQTPNVICATLPSPTIVSRYVVILVDPILPLPIIVFSTLQKLSIYFQSMKMIGRDDLWPVQTPLPFQMPSSVLDSSIYAAYLEHNLFLNQNEQYVDCSTSYQRSPIRNKKRGKLERKGYASFCDSIVFLVRGKIFVLKLSVRRSFRRIKRLFTRKICADGRKSNHEFELNLEAGGGSFVRDNRDKFWRSIEPDSWKSLCGQQEKILRRMEQVLHERSRVYKQQFSFHSGQLGLDLGPQPTMIQRSGVSSTYITRTSLVSSQQQRTQRRLASQVSTISRTDRATAAECARIGSEGMRVQHPSSSLHRAFTSTLAITKVTSRAFCLLLSSS